MGSIVSPLQRIAEPAGQVGAHAVMLMEGVEWDDVNLSVPALCHLIKLERHGLCAASHFGIAEGFVAVLLNEQLALQHLGKPTTVLTRHGVRFRADLTASPPFGENHRDACLAALAEAGVSLDTSLTVAGATHSVRDVLADAVATFSPDQREIEWTALAFLLYLPPASQWTTFDGETFSFDDLAGELKRRLSVGGGACDDIHLLIALTVLNRVDAEYSILTGETRFVVYEVLRRQVDSAVSAQQANGSWVGRSISSMTWTDDPLLVTGHVMEWLRLLPPELQPQNAVYDAAERWLVEALPAASHRGARLCPWTHAICSLLPDAHRAGRSEQQ